MPGAVTVVHVKPGQQVKKGDRLLVMDAMKMQTTVYAPIDGTITEIAVNPRDTVEARDLLLVIE
jgi:pyruvate carboxylase